MRDVLQIRSGSNILGSKVKDFKIVLNSVKVKTPVLDIHPYRAQFTANCKVSIKNMFRDHTAPRYLQGSTQNIKTVAPTYLPPIASVCLFLLLFSWECPQLQCHDDKAPF